MTEKNEIITPEILKGTRDFGPEEMAARDFVMNKIKAVFERFGYDRIETPAIEYAKTILGKYGDEGNKLTYKFKDNGERDVCLRYDQTVPTARFVATYGQNLGMPFKRYQIGPVWRADKPAKGRYREFYQMDVDIIGTESLLADAELAALIDAVFQELNLKNYQLRFSSRRFLNSLLDSMGLVDKQTEIIRIIDKLDKVGEEKIVEELTQLSDESSAKEIVKIISFKGENFEKISFFKDYDVQEVADFLRFALGFGLNEGNLIFDPTIARGLDYYTGMIFEVSLPDVAIGSVCGGGRYDNLCSMFTKENYSGVGVAFGFDRLVKAMEEKNLLPKISSKAEVLVTIFDEESLEYSQKVLTLLHKSGVCARFFPEFAKLGKQMKYADKQKIPFAIIAGSEEIANQEITVKNMQSGENFKLKLEEISQLREKIDSLKNS
jgi:histidyl-tRNA synthetase